MAEPEEHRPVRGQHDRRAGLGRADDTGYVFTTRRSALTGLPRFDRLRRWASSLRPTIGPAPDRADLASGPRRSGQAGRAQRAVSDRFWTSDHYLALVRAARSREIAAAARRNGMQLAFMPHPHLQPALALMDLPHDIVALSSYGATTPRTLTPDTAVLVTDFSSVAFNAGRASTARSSTTSSTATTRCSGAHIGRPGLLRLRARRVRPGGARDDQAVAAVVAAIDARGPRPAGVPGADRSHVPEPRRPRCCERVVAAIEELSRPYRAVEAPRS